MSEQTNVPTGFRKILRGELPAWQAEGILSPSQADSLTGRYDLAGLPAESANIFLIAICVLGAALIGGGVISFRCLSLGWDRQVGEGGPAGDGLAGHSGYRLLLAGYLTFQANPRPRIAAGWGADIRCEHRADRPDIPHPKPLPWRFRGMGFGDACRGLDDAELAGGFSLGHCFVHLVYGVD